MLGKNFSRRHFDFFLFIRNKILHFMQIVSLGRRKFASRVRSNFLGKTIASLSSTESAHSFRLIVLGLNDTSTLVGHFVSSPREREKRDRRDCRRDEREEQGERGTGMEMKKQKK